MNLEAGLCRSLDGGGCFCVTAEGLLLRRPRVIMPGFKGARSICVTRAVSFIPQMDMGANRRPTPGAELIGQRQQHP